MNGQRARESHGTRRRHRGQNQRCCVPHWLQIWPGVEVKPRLGARTKEKWNQVLGAKQKRRAFAKGQTAMSKLIRGAVTASVPSGAIQEGTA